MDKVVLDWFSPSTLGFSSDDVYSFLTVFCKCATVLTSRYVYHSLTHKVVVAATFSRLGDSEEVAHWEGHSKEQNFEYKRNKIRVQTG
jgi:hypothetical protein